MLLKAKQLYWDEAKKGFKLSVTAIITSEQIY